MIRIDKKFWIISPTYCMSFNKALVNDLTESLNTIRTLFVLISQP